jgi:Flp pilus assembly protein TadG
MKQSSHKSFCRQRGTALVELAISLSLLLLITLGAVEYSWLFLKQEQITNAARQASRLASTPSATNATVTSQITTLMTSYGLTNSGYATTFTPGNIATAATGSNVTVKVAIPYNNLTLTHFSLLPLPTTISASVTMVKEGL